MCMLFDQNAVTWSVNAHASPQDNTHDPKLKHGTCRSTRPAYQQGPPATAVPHSATRHSGTSTADSNKNHTAAGLVSDRQKKKRITHGQPEREHRGGNRLTATAQPLAPHQKSKPPPGKAPPRWTQQNTRCV
ncbi:Hypothetical predicted protein [Pelobates cultripes]|uniref:Uncharacterized protein n=1 Tax=Pelobates cultripes TaxID=61616 RepID=A0AAD1SQK2_PELCU|nr:Hypothetical predicted protein [Pelobates cultripes]